ncbi:hypothetical protein GCM10010340_03480 [Streptomyces griseoloalbus]|nr:hypothetical protein GCM10010340_03480 [Streptomyces albaduncus]
MRADTSAPTPNWPTASWTMTARRVRATDSRTVSQILPPRTERIDIGSREAVANGHAASADHAEVPLSGGRAGVGETPVRREASAAFLDRGHGGAVSSTDTAPR